MPIKSFFLINLLSFLLLACGGGSGSNGSTPIASNATPFPSVTSPPNSDPTLITLIDEIVGYYNIVSDEVNENNELGILLITTDSEFYRYSTFTDDMGSCLIPELNAEINSFSDGNLFRVNYLDGRRLDTIVINKTDSHLYFLDYFDEEVLLELEKIDDDFIGEYCVLRHASRTTYRRDSQHFDLYDSNDRLNFIYETLISDFDNELDFFSYYTYGERGDLSQKINISRSGSEYVEFDYIYEFSGDTPLARYQTYERTILDNNLSVSEYGFIWSNGQPQYRTYTELDFDKDGLLLNAESTRTLYQINESGYITGRLFDDSDTAAAIYHLNELGLTEYSEFYDDETKNISGVTRYEYNNFNHIRMRTQELYNLTTGEIDETDIYTYDFAWNGDGKLLLIQVRSDPSLLDDGVSQTIPVDVYEYEYASQCGDYFNAFQKFFPTNSLRNCFDLNVDLLKSIDAHFP